MADNSNDRSGFRPSLRPAPAKADLIWSLLSEPLEDEPRVLDALVAGMVTGDTTPQMFERLHDLALRSERIVELGFAYERLSREPRVKMLPKQKQAELFVYAATFFDSVFGDPDGAVSYAERAVQAAPDNLEVFAKLEALLGVTGDAQKLAKACIAAAGHRQDKDEKLRLLRRAVELVDAMPDGKQTTIPLHQQIVALDPGDARSREALAHLYSSTRRFRELAHLLEEALQRKPPLPDAQADELRYQLLALYRGELRDPQKAAPHVEALLARESVSTQALQAAEALLDNKALAPRLAPLLSEVYRRAGRHTDEAMTLAIELKSAKPPRLAEVHRRLAILRQDVLEDPSGALELLEPLISRDPSDDELRRRYLQVSETFHRQIDAARLLARSLNSVKDPTVRGRVGLEIASLYTRHGDPRRAQEALQQVLASGADDATKLVAARLMLELTEQSKDPKVLAAALEQIVQLDTELSTRITAAKRLAELCEREVNDPVRAAVAWKALLHSPRGEEALERLEALYQKTGDDIGLADLAEHRASRSKDKGKAREYAFRAAELRSYKTNDAAGAAQIWKDFIAKYGPSRDAHAHLIPVLEHLRASEDLARVLEREIELSPAEERAPLLARLGNVRLTFLDNPQAGLSAFRQALTLDPKEKTSRRAVERLLLSGDHRLVAADILEPLYRKDENWTAVVRTFEIRADLSKDAAAQLSALQEAANVAESRLGDAKVGLAICSRAVGVAARSRPEQLTAWLERFHRAASEVGGPAERAAALQRALGDLAIDTPHLARLARETAEAQVAAGDTQGAIQTYRRALAYEPTSPELLRHVDELLEQRGSPQDRLALYRAALEQPADAARRRDLMHAIARIQQKDLGDLEGAVATWQQLVAEHPSDLTAHESLMNAFRTTGNKDALLAEIERGLEHLQGQRRVSSQLAMAEVLAQQGQRARSLAMYRKLMGEAELDAIHLGVIEGLADAEGDVETLRQVLDRRISLSQDPADQVQALERLGHVLWENFVDPDGALETWKAGARLSRRTPGEEQRGRRLFERILYARPDDSEAADALIDLYAGTDEWQKIPDVFDVLLRGDVPVAHLVERVLDLESRAVAASATGAYLRVLDDVLETEQLELGRRRRDLMISKARVLVGLPALEDEAVRTYRLLLEEYGNDEDIDAFQNLLAKVSVNAARADDTRWLFQWRTDHAEPEKKTSILISWARWEEAQADAERAIAVYERILQSEPANAVALTALSRLKMDMGDVEGVLETLRSLRGRGELDDLAAIDLQIASILIERLDRPQEAIELLASVLESSPTDAEALRIARIALAKPESQSATAAALVRAAQKADESTRAAMLRVLIDASDGSLDLRPQRAQWYGELVELTADSEAAFAIALEGAASLPEIDALWDAAERLARRTQRPNAVVEAHRRALEQRLEPEVAEAIGRRMVDFHEEWFEDPDTVLRLLERVLELAPRARWALDRVKLAFNSEGRWEDLFKLYNNAIAGAVDAAEREDLLDEAALAAKDLANDTDRAIAYLEQLVPLRPGDSRLDATLERLYERQGDPKKLVAMLEKRLKGLEGGELIQLELRLAGLWLDAGDPVKAFELTEQALEADADQDSAYDLLERILSLSPSVDLKTGSVDLKTGKKSRGKKSSIYEEAVKLLKKRYESGGRPQDLVRVLQAELAVVVDPAELKKKLERLVALRLEEIDDPEGAFDNVAALVALNPSSREERKRFAELGDRIGAHERRAALLVQIAADQAKPVKRELLREAAALYESPLGTIEKAIDLNRQVLALSAGETADALDAAYSLQDLLGRAERPVEQCIIVERIANLESDPIRRKAAWAKVAGLALEHLDDPDRARSAWQARLEDDPSDAEALDGLESVLEILGRYDDLARVLETRARVRGGEDARRDRVRLARLYQEKIGNPAAAIDTWKALRAELGPDDESFDALAELLEADSRWEELAELLATAAASADKAPQRAELYCMLGDLHRDRTGDALRAVRAYVAAGEWRRAIDVASGVTDREHGIAVATALLNLATEVWTGAAAEAHEEAANAAYWALQSLAKRLLEEGAHEDVVALNLRGAALPFDRVHRRHLLRDAAWTTCDRLNDAPRAIEILQRLFAEDAADEVARASVARYARLLEESGRMQELAVLWEDQARCRSEAGDRPGASALWARAAQIWETRLGDADRAIAVHRQGAALGGEASLEALGRLYTERKNYRAAAVALEWLCAQSTRETLVARALALADLYVKLGERDRARARLERAASIGIDAQDVRTRLADLYREDGAWLPLSQLLLDEASRASDKKTRMRLLREAASIHLKQRNDPGSAIPLLETAAELEPDEPAFRLALSEAMCAAGRFTDAAQMLRAQIERYGSRKPKDRALVHLHLARVSLSAGQRAEALSELDVAAKINPAHPGILFELSRLALDENQLARAEKTYRALLLVLRRPEDNEDGGPGRAEVYLDLSKIASKQGDDVRAAEFVESAFEAALENETEALSLERALRSAGRNDLLARALERRLEAAPEPVKAAKALADLVTLNVEQGRGDKELSSRIARRASKIFEELSREDSSDAAAWNALSKVYQWVGKGEEEAKILERRVAAIPLDKATPEDAEVLYRLAKLRFEIPDRRAEGVAFLERALELRPDYERAEQLLSAAIDNGPSDASVLGLLEQVARASGRDELLTLCIARAAAAGVADAAKIREGVELGLSIGRKDLVTDMLRADVRSPESASGRADALWRHKTLGTLLLEQGDVASAVVAKESAAELADAEESRQLLLEVASLSMAPLSDYGRAVRIYSTMLKRDPADRDVWEPLLDVYRRRGDHAQLIELIESTVPLVESLSDRSRLRFEEATLMLEDPARSDDAAELLKDIIADDPSMHEAAELLSDLLEKQGRFDELARLVEAQLDIAQSNDDSAAIESMSLKLGALLERQNRIQTALDVYNTLLDWNPTSRAALRATARLHEQTRADPYALADAIERLLRVEQGEAAGRLAHRLIALRTEQNDAEGVERALEIGLTANPADTELREKLLATCSERGDLRKAAAVLKAAYDASPQDRDLLLRAVEACRACGDYETALDIVSAALGETPNDAELYFERSKLLDATSRHEEALMDLETAHTAGGGYTGELIVALERAIARGDDDQVAEHTIRLADVVEKLGQTDVAHTYLADLLKMRPKHRDALRRLARLASAAEKWEEASSAYRRLIPLEEGEALVSAAMNLAEACERDGRLSDARSGLERALQVAPDNAELRQRLRGLYQATGANRELAQLLLDEAAAEAKVQARIGLLLAAAELLLENEGNADEAIRVLEEVRSLSPENVHGAVLLARAHAAIGKGEEALNSLNEVVSANRGRRSKELSLLHREISNIHLEAGNLKQAMEALSKAFDIDMRNAELAMQLGYLAMDVGESDVAGRAFRSVTMMKPKQPGSDEGASGESKAAAYYHLSRMARDQGDVRKARLMASKAVSEDPTHADAQALLNELKSA